MNIAQNRKNGLAKSRLIQRLSLGIFIDHRHASPFDLVNNGPIGSAPEWIGRAREFTSNSPEFVAAAEFREH